MYIIAITTLVTNSGMGCHISACFAILVIVSAFSFLSSILLRGHELKKVTFEDDHGRLRFTSETCSYRQRVQAAWYGMFLHSKFIRKLHCSNFSLEIAKLTTPVNFEVHWASQSWAWLHEIAKINTRKIVTIPESQNFVLAINSNNKVCHVMMWVFFFIFLY